MHDNSVKRELLFVEGDLANYYLAIDQAFEKYTITTINIITDDIKKSLASTCGKFSFSSYVSKKYPVVTIHHNGSGDADLIVILPDCDPSDVSTRLMALLDKSAMVVAPITPYFFKNRPLFLVSIPKSGTHLLTKLAHVFGYANGGILPDVPLGGNWYPLEYTNTHTDAKHFFIDTVYESPFGNRHHPFPHMPGMFIYRNPLDILISEAKYYCKPGNTIFSEYFANKDFDEKLSCLISDPALFGTIRDRMFNYIAWLRFNNIMPVSYEELVGSCGGGSDNIRDELIWSLQLKLHIPGEPSEFGKKLYDTQSPTFNEGKIGRHQETFSDENLAMFKSLNQDFMEQLGYGIDMDSAYPSHRESYRKRPLVTLEKRTDIPPFLIGSNFCGYNLVLYKNQYVGILMGLQIDLSKDDYEGNPSIILSQSLESLKYNILSRVQKQNEQKLEVS